MQQTTSPGIGPFGWVLRGLLLLFGIYYVWGNAPPDWPAMTYAAPAAVLALLLIPAVRRAVCDGSRRLGNVRRAWIFLAIWVGATAYLAFTAKQQGRIFIPLWADEKSYIVLAQHLSVGRLWMPEPPAAESFETVYVHARPVYASIYFVGGGIFYAIALLAHLPPWMAAVAVAGLIPAVLYLVLSELTDPLSAIAGAVLILTPGTYRYISIRILSSLPVLLLYLVALAAWLKCCRKPSWPWMVLIGASAGWAAITRPLEAMVGFGLIGGMMLLRLRTLPWRQAVGLIAVCCVAAVPFLLVQGVSNQGVTGRWTTAPWTLYVDRDYPNSGIGFHRFDPDARPASALPQKHELYEWLRPMLENHRPELAWRQFWWVRSYVIPWATMPHPWLFALVPLGFVWLRDPHKAGVLMLLPLLVGAYTLYYWLPPYYLLFATPAAVLAVLLGLKAIVGERRQPAAMIVLMTFCIVQMPEFTGQRDETTAYPQTVEIEEQMRQVSPPAVVFFRFGPGANAHEEPVFQLDWPTPHNAPIARAHDLGEAQNRKLLDWYAANDPQRSVWHFDRPTMTLRKLGSVSDVVTAGNYHLSTSAAKTGPSVQASR